MSILDCGCGPGSITLDLAQLVSPGQAIGIDIESTQIEKAKMLQHARKVSNVEFRVGDLNQLPFDENTFDDWGEDQDIFAAEAWGEAVAWKS